MVRLIGNCCKLQNILVNNRALPTIIDTDSFQVVDPIQNKVYRCLVASEGFTPSELIGKDIDSITQSAIHDRFRLGVVIYYLLFGGPPFRVSWQGSGDMPEQVELIRRGFWPYAPNSLIQPNNNTIPLDIIHPELQRCFLLCFNDGHKNPSKRPSAKVWLGALEVAFNELQSCGKIDSHFYGLSYGHCYLCDRAQNLGIDIFENKVVLISKNFQIIQNKNKQILPIATNIAPKKLLIHQNKTQQKHPQNKQGNLKKNLSILLVICFGVTFFYFQPYFKINSLAHRASAIIDKSENSSYNSYKLNQFNEAKELLDQAVIIIISKRDYPWDSSTLRNMVDSYIKLNHPSTALAIAERIPDSLHRAFALIDIANSYAKISKLNEANNSLNKVLNLVKEIQDSRDKVSILINSAEVYAKLVQFDKSKKFFNQSLVIANQIQDSSHRDWALRDIASAYIELNHFDEALIINKKIQNPIEKSRLLEDIAEAHIKLNQFDQANITLYKALVFANQIQDLEWKLEILQEIAEIYAKFNQFNKALEQIYQLQTTNKEDASEKKNRILRNIAGTYSKLNQFNNAFAVANKIDTPVYTIAALLRIAEAYGRLNQTDNANSVLDNAVEIANQIENSNTKSQILEEISQTSAKIN